jgi:glycosyltransferase involved in cell wall biosynthesis
MAKPWLSVVVTSHNRERWLGGALQSLVDQHDEGIEVIAIDASASDVCWRIISTFSSKLNIRAERRLELQSQTAKINFGVEQAQADRICTKSSPSSRARFDQCQRRSCRGASRAIQLFV